MAKENVPELWLLARPKLYGAPHWGERSDLFLRVRRRRSARGPTRSHPAAAGASAPTRASADAAGWVRRRRI